MARARRPTVDAFVSRSQRGSHGKRNHANKDALQKKTQTRNIRIFIFYLFTAFVSIPFSYNQRSSCYTFDLMFLFFYLDARRVSLPFLVEGEKEGGYRTSAGAMMLRGSFLFRFFFKRVEDRLPSAQCLSLFRRAIPKKHRALQRRSWVLLQLSLRRHFVEES
jgi:hypothetical protein